MKRLLLSLSYRPCEITDLDDLIRISKETFIAAFEKDNDPADFNRYINSAFHIEQMEAQLNHRDSNFYFVYSDKELIGYFKVNQKDAQTDLHDGNAMELERIYVIDTYQNRGIGAWMLEQIVNLGRSFGVDYVWLGVWEQNTAAIKFYQKHGFNKFGTHPYLIGSDKQTDWLLRLEL